MLTNSGSVTDPSAGPEGNIRTEGSVPCAFARKPVIARLSVPELLDVIDFMDADGFADDAMSGRLIRSSGLVLGDSTLSGIWCFSLIAILSHKPNGMWYARVRESTRTHADGKVRGLVPPSISLHVGCFTSGTAFSLM